MCKPTTTNANGTTAATTGRSTNHGNPGKKAASSSKPLKPTVLLSLDSYESIAFQAPTGHNEKNNNHSKHHLPFPNVASFLATLIVVILFLVLSEHAWRCLLNQAAVSLFQQHHMLLTAEVNRQILARHIGVDAFSCAVCAYLGWQARHVSLFPVVRGTIVDGKNDKDKMTTYQDRLYTYHAGALRLSVFFFAYQIKNLFDSIAWNDGPEFIFHHVFSLITAWGAMHPGCGHVYAYFYFGVSEISTAVLCLLANFDDAHGVPGLGEAMPVAKAVLGVLFALLFVLCRCILWPLTSYYFCQDIGRALKDQHIARNQYRRGWLRFFLVSLTGLSVLQVAWLGQIFVLGKQELEKAGFL